MATTSIWCVKNRLDLVVDYVKNPKKTENPAAADGRDTADRELRGISDVIAYAMNEEKTKGNVGNPDMEAADENATHLQQYVSGVNCSPSTALVEMRAVKKRYGKDDGILAFHGYQSFAPGECTPDMAHEIGLKLAEELWGNRFQVVVATHLDKKHHLHNHFVVNSVSFTDGLRYHRSNKDYYEMRKTSDRLCKEYGLSVIETDSQKKGKHYGEWKAEQEGRPTQKSIIKADVDEAIAKARTEKQFYHFLREKGYHLKFGKDITAKPPGKDRGMKLARNLGEAYTREAICKRILNQSVAKSTPAQPSTEGTKKILTVIFHGNLNHGRKIGGLRGLYLHYCYRLGILPKNRPPIPPSKLHFLLREDLRKLDAFTKETRLLCRNRIDTTEQLFSFRESLRERLEVFGREREHLRNKLRRMKNEDTRTELKIEIAGISKQMGELRKEVRLCDGIAARSATIKEKLKTVRRETAKGKEDKSDEHIRRGR